MLEQEFQRLKPADQSVEFRLLELKQKMGLKLPAGASDNALLMLSAGSGVFFDLPIAHERILVLARAESPGRCLR